MPGPGLCGRCGYENDPHVRVCEACGMEFPAPPGMVAGTDGSSTQDDDA